MKVLKIRKSNNTQYKQKCCKCSSKLLIDYEDLYCPAGYGFKRTFKCPICKTAQFLNKRNEKKAELYRYYTMGLKNGTKSIHEGE